MKLSVVIITKNEERIISRCLDAVKWADEIIIADSGSTDRTLEIAKRFKAKIFKKTWAGYSKQKNFAISKAKGDWILSLDADEIVTPELKDEIYRVIAPKTPLNGQSTIDNRKSALNGYFIPRKTYFYGHLMRFGNTYPDSQMRLFKKGKASFEETDIHERAVVEGQAGELKNSMLHYSKTDIASHISAINSYTELEVKKAIKAGYRPTGYSVLIKPLLYFMKHYIWKAGFLDGVPGFIYYNINAMYIFIREVKIMEALGMSKINLLGTILKRAK